MTALDQGPKASTALGVSDVVLFLRSIFSSCCKMSFFYIVFELHMTDKLCSFSSFHLELAQILLEHFHGMFSFICILFVTDFLNGISYSYFIIDGFMCFATPGEMIHMKQLREFKEVVFHFAFHICFYLQNVLNSLYSIAQMYELRL